MPHYNLTTQNTVRRYMKTGNFQLSSHSVFIPYSLIPISSFYQLLKRSHIYLILYPNKQDSFSLSCG